ncbi:inositol monophosphatase [Candidatus Gottesmanbacteria bacterium]|nr:inositol monophosphatase [Candidatus Gottesmanbacteria bacterium]
MKDYVPFAIDMAYKAGTIMRKNFTLGMKKTFKQTDSSPLTISDTTINHMVIKAIDKEFPTHKVIGEEESNKKNNSEYAWVCDPIDGTVPFSSGIPIFTFSLALTKYGTPIVGVIYDPFMDRLFVGKKGEGAFLNNKKIFLSKSKKINTQAFYMGWWKHSLYDLLLVRRELCEKECKIMDFCSFAYAGALVASGEFSCVIYGDHYPWDVAAMKVIIEEAGGICTDFTGKDQRYDRDVNGFIASNGGVHKELLALVKQFAVKN